VEEKLSGTSPTITAVISLYGLIATDRRIRDHVAELLIMLPAGFQSVVLAQVDRLIAQGDVTLGVAFVTALLLALWSSNAGTKSVVEALNVAYGEVEKRNVLHLNAITLLLTSGGIAAIVAALSVLVIIPQLIADYRMSWIEAALVYGRWPVVTGVAIGAFAALYRYLPSRRAARWTWVWPGAILAAVLWILASGALSLYLSWLADFEASYGTLGGLVAALMWMWISVVAFLAGAEFNSEAERQTLADTTDGVSLPLGQRGAHAADTVGAVP
jgi:membrane protein